MIHFRIHIGARKTNSSWRKILIKRNKMPLQKEEILVEKSALSFPSKMSESIIWLINRNELAGEVKQNIRFEKKIV